MPKFHSHYENLKVARDASPEAIRAAYRSLSSTYHPDRNAGNAEASRIMSVINVAYGVLSDPARKREHDEWIAQAERESGSAPARQRLRTQGTRRHESPFTPHAPAEPDPEESRAQAPGADKAPRRWPVHLARYGLAYGLAGLLLYMLLDDEPAVALLGSMTRGAEPASAKAAPVARYVRPAQAPNGQGWPEQTGYLAGYDLLNAAGLSEVTIDNSANDADMFAKLVSLDGPQASAVRLVLVRAHTRFKLTKLTSGTYDLRYRNLANGRLSRSQFFTLEEVPTANGPLPSSMTVALDGAHEMKAYGLSEGEF